jgi:colicin import membrane protein
VSAEAALEKARREHDKRVSGIETERAAIDRRSEVKDSRWEKRKEKLKGALRRAHTWIGLRRALSFRRERRRRTGAVG